MTSSIDRRTRLRKDIRSLAADDVFGATLPEAIGARGELAGRGVAYKNLPPLGLSTDGWSVTLAERDGTLELVEGQANAGVVAELDAPALSDLVQDVQSTMGLAMTSRVQVTQGSFDHWVSWEPALRALLDGRPVHETGAVDVAVDVTRTFTLDDDQDEMAHFLAEAGFLHVRDVFTPGEMNAVSADLDDCLDVARPDDGESWWATTSAGQDLPVRILWFEEKSAALAPLLTDDRLAWMGDLTGDGHDCSHPGAAEGLTKPLDIERGLSDLPWHRDCGQGFHSYMCNSLTVGISVTGADSRCGALGVIPGSHRANTVMARERSLDLQPIMLETATGDITVHCSDTLHRAHPPIEQPRRVVYTSFSLPALPGDVVPPSDRERSRKARAALTNVEDRIDAAGHAR